MDISLLGANTAKISGKNITAIADPADGKAKADVVLLTKPGDFKSEAMLIDGPGEYEVKGTMITGVPADEDTIYSLKVDGVAVGIVGSVSGLSDAQIEDLGQIDVLTLQASDPAAAAKIVSQLEPKYVVPLGGDNEAFLKEMGASPEPVSKLKLNAKEMPLETTVVVLSKSSI